MTAQQTLSIIKPDATRRNLIGSIVSKLEKSGLKPNKRTFQAKV